MLPPLQNLSLTAIDVSGVKRSRGRDDSIPLDTEDEQNKRDWNNDKSNWTEIVCRVWDGRPFFAGYSWQTDAPYLSPDGDWKNRELVPTSEIEKDEAGVASCKVLQNIHGFDPTGAHNMDMDLLRKKLDVHYPDTSEAAAREFALSTLPASYATRYDIQVWIDGLFDKGFAPWWILDNDDAFEGWKKMVKPRNYPYGVTKTTDNAGKIEYPMLGQVYIGETKKHNGRVVPHGLGMLTFLDKSMWRGKWLFGTRTGDIGVFTDPDGNITLGRWDTGRVRIKSTTALAQEELDEWNYDRGDSTLWTDSVLVEKPGWGRIAVASAKVGAVLRMANWHTETAMARMMGTTDPFELGVGRDTRSYLDKPHAYTKLLPLAVFDVDYTNSYVLQSWERYQYFLEEQLKSDLAEKTFSSWRGTRMQKACPDEGFYFGKDIYHNPTRGRLGLMQEPYEYVQSNLASLGVPLREETNEQFLLHAIKPESLFAILNNSFDMSFGGKGLFGGGIYFADDPGKSDQYATPSPLSSDICKRLGLDRKNIKDDLKAHSVYPKRVQSRKDAKRERAKEKVDDARAMKDEDESSEGFLTDDYLSDDSNEHDSDEDLDVFFMLVARVPLGRVASLNSIDRFQENKLPKRDKRKDVLLMSDATYEFDDDGDKVWNMSRAKNLAEPYNSLACQGPLRYREYVVYKNAVARVSHVIAYCRARQTTMVKVPPSASVLRSKPNAKPTYEFSNKDRENLLYQDNTKSPYRRVTPEANYRDPYQADADSEDESTDEDV